MGLRVSWDAGAIIVRSNVTTSASTAARNQQTGCISLEAMQTLNALIVIVTIPLTLQARMSLCTIVARILKNCGGDIGAIIIGPNVTASAGIAPWNQCAGRLPVEAIQSFSALFVIVAITLALHARISLGTPSAARILKTIFVVPNFIAKPWRRRRCRRRRLDRVTEVPPFRRQRIAPNGWLAIWVAAVVGLLAGMGVTMR